MNYKKMFILFLGAIILIAAQGCKPVVVLSVKSLDFGSTETQKTIQVWNKTANTNMDFEITKAANWLTVNPASGTSKGPSDKKTITITVSRAGLQPGSHSDTLKVKSPQDGEELLTVNMTVSSGQEGEPEGTTEGITEGTTEGETEGQTEPNISITGWINDTNTNPIAYATVELVNTSFKVYSDQTGLYMIVGNVPKGTYVLSVTKEGYAPYSIEVEVGNTLPVTVNVTLVKQIKIQEVPNIENGATVIDPEGNGIKIPPNSVYDKVGNPVTGPVEVYITPLNFSQPNDILAFPGGFQGVPSSKQGERVDLESFALADFTIKKDGKEVLLDTSAKADDPAEITLDLPDDSPLNAGEEVPLWYFDEEKGIWIESGKGTVYNDGGNKYYKAPVQHLTWWNCDAPITDKTCIQGIVKDKDGNPVVGAVVKAIGSSYNGVTTTTTDNTGFFCLNVKGNSTVTLRVYLPGGNITVYEQTVNANSVGNSCETGGCLNVGNIVTEFDSCIQGTVTDNNGTPVTNATVRSSIGLETTTDNSGNYCLDAISGVPITVYVISRPPVTVTAQTNTSCPAGNCAIANIQIEYPKNGDYIGILSVTTNKSQGIPTKTTQYSVVPTAIFVPYASPPYEQITDQCSVQSIQRDYSQHHDPYSEIFPETNWAGLDPGSPGIFTSADQTGNLLRMADVYSNFGEEFKIYPWMYSIFVLNYEDYIYTSQEQPSFTASWPGGLDIGAFEVTGQTPPPLELTSPTLTPYPYGGHYSFNFNPEEDLILNWNANSGTRIYVQLVGSVFDYQTQTMNTTIITCVLNDDGTHTIPKEMLQQLPVPNQNQYLSVSLNITRKLISEVNVPLTRGGNGILVIESQTTISASQYSQIPVSITE